MTFPYLVAALLALGASPSVARSTAGGCVAPSGGTLQFYVDVAAPTPRDSEVTARLCLASGTASVGSYHVTLHYDAASLTVKHLQQSPSGMHAVNSQNAGVINIAGVAVSGFQSGALLTVRFRAVKRVTPRLKLVLLEVSGRDGADLRHGTHVAGYPAKEAQLGVLSLTRTDTTSDAGLASGPASAPSIAHISPSAAEVSSENVAEVSIRGTGFSRTENTVLFGTAALGPLPSTDGVTIRFVVPTYFPSRGEVSPRRVTPGKYPIRVQTRGGTSNSLMFTVRDE